MERRLRGAVGDGVLDYVSSSITYSNRLLRERQCRAVYYQKSSRGSQSFEPWITALQAVDCGGLLLDGTTRTVTGWAPRGNTARRRDRQSCRSIAAKRRSTFWLFPRGAHRSLPGGLPVRRQSNQEHIRVPTKRFELAGGIRLRAGAIALEPRRAASAPVRKPAPTPRNQQKLDRRLGRPSSATPRLHSGPAAEADRLAARGVSRPKRFFRRD